MCTHTFFKDFKAWSCIMLSSAADDVPVVLCVLRSVALLVALLASLSRLLTTSNDRTAAAPPVPASGTTVAYCCSLPTTFAMFTYLLCVHAETEKKKKNKEKDIKKKKVTLHRKKRMP